MAATTTDPHVDGLGHHVSPVRVYWLVFGALLVFTVLTYAVSFANLGVAALPVAMLVASVKASLVCTFFMHLKYDERFNVLIFLSSLFFMGVFFVFTMMDVATRALVDPVEGYGVYEMENPTAVERPTRAAEIRASEAAAAEAAAEAAGEGEEAAPSEDGH